MRLGTSGIRGRNAVARLFSAREERAAAASLGPDHELVRVLSRRLALRRQLVVTSTVAVLAATGAALGASGSLVVLGAAGAVEVVVVLALLYSRGRTRDMSQEVLASGDDAALPIGSVRAERRRLASRRERERIARSLERLLQDAERWHRILPAYRPPDGTQLLRFAADEVREIVALLRAETAHLRGVALTSRLLMDGHRSPLYAGDVGRLREELNRIRYLLHGADDGYGRFDARAAA
jgi:hypothetical protein